MPDLKVFEIMMLCERFGYDAKLSDVLDKVRAGRVYECPKCHGVGTIKEEYNGYPSGLPDSGFVYEAAYRTVDCDLCQGHGYTKDKYVPRMVQDGWEKSI